jgi:hypothetical protein
MRATVAKPYYDWDGRKYMDFLVENKTVRLKVPFRYGRTMCRVEGIRPIQEFELGESVEITTEVKIWDGREFLILTSISSSQS